MSERTPKEIIEAILNYCIQARFDASRTAAEIARALRREFMMIPTDKEKKK